MDEDIEIDPNRVLEIIQQENPMVLEMARRRAIIERQNEIIVALHSATLNGQEALS